MRLVIFWKNSFRFYEVSTSFPEKKNTFLLAKFRLAPSDVLPESLFYQALSSRLVTYEVYPDMRKLYD